MDEYLWIRNRRYYYHDTYATCKKAKQQAKYYKKKHKCKSYILKVEEQGFLDIIPEIKYRLYLNKVIHIW